METPKLYIGAVWIDGILIGILMGTSQGILLDLRSSRWFVILPTGKSTTSEQIWDEEWGLLPTWPVCNDKTCWSVTQWVLGRWFRGGNSVRPLCHYIRSIVGTKCFAVGKPRLNHPTIDCSYTFGIPWSLILDPRPIPIERGWFTVHPHRFRLDDFLFQLPVRHAAEEYACCHAA